MSSVYKVLVLVFILLIEGLHGIDHSFKYDKTVFLGMIIKNDDPLIPTFLQTVERLDYDKKLIRIQVNIYNDSSEIRNTLMSWIDNNKEKYAEISFEYNEGDDLLDYVYSNHRCQTFGKIKDSFLEKTNNFNCDYCFIIESDIFLAPFSLKHLISKNKSVVSPLLRPAPKSNSLFRNYYTATDENGYYLYDSADGDITGRHSIGTFKVDSLSGPYLIKAEYVNQLSFQDDTDDWEFISFSRNAKSKNVNLYICNEREFGKFLLFENDNITLKEEKEFVCPDILNSINSNKKVIVINSENLDQKKLNLGFKSEKYSKPNRKLKVNIFGEFNGKGIETDRQILKIALESLGHEVTYKSWHDRPHDEEPYVDLNIFLETLVPDWYALATLNWYIPNPEINVPGKLTLAPVDLILCRTHEVERIYKNRDKKTYYMGFASWDTYKDNVEKDFSLYLHAPGASPYKGTSGVIKSWRNKQLPNMIFLVQNVHPSLSQPNVQWICGKIPTNLLRVLQNHCGVHICTSESEGFGHYIMEAMAAKSVVVTTDAPPMNEFIKDKRCLVPYKGSGSSSLATMYYVNEVALESTVLNLQLLPKETLKKMGEENREAYLQRKEEFYDNFVHLLEQVK